MKNEMGLVSKNFYENKNNQASIVLLALYSNSMCVLILRITYTPMLSIQNRLSNQDSGDTKLQVGDSE